MKQSILQQLENMPFFERSALSALEKASNTAIDQNLKRWINKGILFRLKNGMYVTKTFVDRNMHNPSYIELIANSLLIPSYLSLEYVLQKNNLLTEATWTITSVTTKTTRQYNNKLGTFHYYTLNKKLFCGFNKYPYGANYIYEASQAKALFDFFYLRLKNLDPKDNSTIAEYRINWFNLNKTDFNEFIDYITMSKIKKMQALIEHFKGYWHGNFS